MHVVAQQQIKYSDTRLNETATNIFGGITPNSHEHRPLFQEMYPELPALTT